MIKRAEPTHLGVQQPDCIVGGVIGAEGVRADQLGKALRAVRVGHPVRPHLVQHHGNAGIGDLPGGFRAGEARANDVHGLKR